MSDIGEKLGTVGLVCASSGLRCAILAGYLRSFARFSAKHRITLAYAKGVSAAALSIVRYCEAETPDEYLPIVENSMYPTWKEIEMCGPKKIFTGSKTNLWGSPSIAKNHDSLFWILKNCDPKKLIASPTRVEIPVFKESTQCYHVYSNRDQIFCENPELIRRVAAASASPGPHFPSLYVYDDTCYDGAFVDALRAVDFGCDTIFFLVPYPHPNQYRKPKPLNGFIAEHFPVLELFRTRFAALIRNRDMCGLENVERHNEHVEVFWKVVAEKDKKIEELERKLGVHEERASRARNSLLSNVRDFLHDQVERLKRLGESKENLLSDLDDFSLILDSKQLNMIRPVRVVSVYCQPPETLTMDDFRPPVYKHEKLICEGDITIGLRLGETAMESVIEELETTL